ncbi:hypothetical protein ACI3PH_08115 [Lactococcus lactis]
MAKYTFQFSKQINFEAEDFSSVHKLLTFLEDENERLKVQEQTASFSLKKLDKNGKVIANFERIDFPIDVWDERLFEPLYEHNDRYLKKHPELASIVISEKPQTEEESQISINKTDNVALSEEDNSWEKQLLEASEKELLARQSDEQKEEQTFSYSSSEDTKVPTFSEPTITGTDVVETFFVEGSEGYFDVASPINDPISIETPDVKDHLNILDHIVNSDDQELNQLLADISTFLDKKLTSYTSKMEQSTNQELQSIDRREEVKKMLLDQCSQLTHSQIKSLTEQLTEEKARAISDEQTRHQSELSRIEADFNKRLQQGKQNIEMTNISNAQKEIEKNQAEISSSLSNYAKTKAEQNQGKLTLMKSKLQDTFSSIFKKNILKEASYHDEILSKFETQPSNSNFLNSDASNKVQSLHVAKSKDEQYSQAPKKYHLVK